MVVLVREDVFETPLGRGLSDTAIAGGIDSSVVLAFVREDELGVRFPIFLSVKAGAIKVESTTKGISTKTKHAQDIQKIATTSTALGK